MLVRKIVKTALFCGLGVIIGKVVSEQKQKADLKKILSADYLDDRTKVELMQDLNGIKISHQVKMKEKAQRKLIAVKNQSLKLAKNLANNAIQKIDK